MHRLLKTLSSRHVVRRYPCDVSCLKNQLRRFADPPKSDIVNKKQITGTESEKILRVRRACPSDVPRVLRFVREHACITWPNFATRAQPENATHIALCDYVSRALAQGHSMLAEQHEAKRGSLHIKGLALCLNVCPWDAAMLEGWARCVRSDSSKRLMQFTAHCLRAPGLHEKYKVHNIMQVIFIVPNDTQSIEVIRMLTNNVIKRGKDVGFPLLRFDVNNEDVAKVLESMQLMKEWCISFDVIPENKTVKLIKVSGETKPGSHFIAVYTAMTKEEKAQNA